MTRMNISASLEFEFTQFKNNDIRDSMKSLLPTDSFAVLSVTMKRGGLGGLPIRHVPIIEPASKNEPRRGKLKALISQIDLVTLQSPPWRLVPKDVIDQGLIDMQSLKKDILSMCRKNIQESFPELFLGKPPEISVSQSVGDAIKLLTSTYGFDMDGNTKTRRYKTIPVFNQQHTLIGMLSYMDFLREITRNGHEKFLKKKVSCFLQEIGQRIENIDTIPSDSCIFDATNLFSSVSYTHLPVINSEGMVEGIIDDVIVNTYEHQAFISAFASVSLSKIYYPIDQAKNVVSLDDEISVVINRFFLKDRPTAVLVGRIQNSKLQLEGIISYLDILRNFEKTFLASSSSDETTVQGENS